MNERIKQIAERASATKKHVPAVWQFYDYELEHFVELITQEHIELLQREWYKLNDASPVVDESPRDIGIRVGRKSELISMIELLKNHYKEKQ